MTLAEIWLDVADGVMLCDRICVPLAIVGVPVGNTVVRPAYVEYVVCNVCSTLPGGTGAVHALPFHVTL